MLNKFVITYSTYETGNHPDLVSALHSDLLSDYMTHSGPKLCFLVDLDVLPRRKSYGV